MDATEELVQEHSQQSPASSNIETNPVSKQSFFNKKTLVIIVSSLGIIILGTLLTILYRGKQNSSRGVPKESISLTPTIQPTNLPAMKVYTDDFNGFKFLYPGEYLLSTSSQGGTPVLNHTIDWSISPKIECGDEQGDCPYVEQKRDTIELVGYVTIKITGTLAGVGGNIPGSYISYYVKHPTQESYFRMTLYEVPLDDNSPEFDSKYPMNRTPQPIPKAEEIVLDKIIQTFSFISEN